jgi:hypothetical protein
MLTGGSFAVVPDSACFFGTLVALRLKIFNDICGIGKNVLRAGMVVASWDIPQGATVGMDLLRHFRQWRRAYRPSGRDALSGS